MFKTTYNILKKSDEDELQSLENLNLTRVFIPPTTEWDYSREMTIEDVDIWEILSEQSGALGVYAAYKPLAEFYMITCGPDYKNPPRVIDGFLYHDKIVETYYGPGCQQKVYNRARQLGILLFITPNVWVDDDKMWLYNTNT